MTMFRESLPGSADVRDGLHLSAKGHKLLFQEVERVIKGSFERDPEVTEASEVKSPTPLVLPG